MKYISSIRESARKYGAAKIIPPSDKWLQGKPFSKVVDPKNFIFQTKLQNIHQLMTRNGPNQRFMEDLEMFHAKKGMKNFLQTIPEIDGRGLDMYKLYMAVMARGGLQQVSFNWYQS